MQLEIVQIQGVVMPAGIMQPSLASVDFCRVSIETWTSCRCFLDL